MNPNIDRHAAGLLEAAAPDGGPVRALPNWGITRLLPAGDVRYHTPIRYRLHYRLDRHLLHYSFDSSPIAASFTGMPAGSRLRTGALCVVPAGTPALLEVQEPVEFLCITVARRRWPNGQAGESATHPGVAVLEGVMDAGITALMLELRRALIADTGDATPYLDALVRAAVMRVAMRAPEWSAGAPASGSATAAIRAAVAHMDANLGRSLGVAELAAVAGLSKHHFSRQFKLATGSAPHAYLLRRRVLRARELIERSTLPLADVALQTGFSSQAHMTDAFRKHLQVSPARLRRG